ncbi:hypothetical protein GIB67_022101 [Kingdonia uniflora]|uniref:Uncharacterized protein n=1 Tax=Kingdonia uniflora TaxID=39325 RepID=A0A7J7LXQ8_9MAGN|nr:hypothetical protein GIB67_022101 [Kingdonia uniflora]
MYRIVKKSLQLKVKKMSLLYTVAQEGVELEIVLKDPAVEDRVRLTTHKGTEEMSASVQLELGKMIKGICLGIEEGKAKLENGKVELKKKVDRLKSDLVLEEKAEVKVIMDGTYIEEEVVKKDVPGMVGGLDGISPWTELKNQGEDNEKVE